MPRRQAVAGILRGVMGAGAVCATTGSRRAHAGSSEIHQILGRTKTDWTAIKATAINDYRTSLSPFGGCLSSNSQKLLAPTHSQCRFHYDVVVIGSGYGASVCAARLATKLQPQATLCVLERGKEWAPGTFPDTFRDAIGESRTGVFGPDKRTIKNPLGMLNLQQYDDLTVFTGSALGGTSLINANVAIRPDHEVFHQPQWPTYLRDRSFLDPYFDRAEWELGVQREPVDLTHKMRAQRLAAEALADCGAYYEASALTITRASQLGLPILNRQGMVQRPCTSCGDCMTGCNVGAKNTLAMNYLPLARRAGAEIFSQTEVLRIEKCDGHYVVWFRHYVLDPFGNAIPVEGSLRARIVILGAGCVGSTELLLKSQSSNFQFSNRLGYSFSGNGDILGVIRGTTVPTGIDGFGAYDECRLVGPTIQSNLSYPHRPSLHHRVIIQDGVAARAYANAMMVFGRDFRLENTQIVLVSGHDGAMGRIELDESGRAVVRWPNLYHHPYRKFAEAEIQRVAHAIGGEYREMAAFKGRVGTVHPLGGCSMSDDPACGVVDHRGRVFDGCHGGFAETGQSTPAVHRGLYVADGAVMPTSLGVNPLATISAIAERTAEYITLDPEFADLFRI